MFPDYFKLSLLFLTHAFKLQGLLFLYLEPSYFCAVLESLVRTGS